MDSRKWSLDASQPDRSENARLCEQLASCENLRGSCSSHCEFDSLFRLEKVQVAVQQCKRHQVFMSTVQEASSKGYLRSHLNVMLIRKHVRH